MSEIFPEKLSDIHHQNRVIMLLWSGEEKIISTPGHVCLHLAIDDYTVSFYTYLLLRIGGFIWYSGFKKG